MSNNKIPCDTVRDLFPSYIDQLTSDTTNHLIEEHIADCAACSDILHTMRYDDVLATDLPQFKTILYSHVMLFNFSLVSFT